MADPRIERILSQSDLNSSQLREVREAIYSSPYLVSAMGSAIDARRITRIGLSDNPHEGGHYDASAKAINVNPDAFSISDKRTRQDGLVSVIGHETGHALMAGHAERSRYEYAFRVEAAIRTGYNNGDSSVDINSFSKAYADSARKNEGFSELLSMNALASRLTASHGAFDVTDFLERADRHTDCIDKGILQAGIQLDAIGMQRVGSTVADSSAVERVAVCHFDQGPASLGRKGTSNYDDYYAADSLGLAARVWRDFSQGTTRPPPPLALDVDLMKTSKQRMEDAGVDLGQPGRSFDFVAISDGQRRIESITQHGAEPSHRHPDALYDKPLLANNPAHQDFATFDRIHQWVKGTGHWNEEQSLNVSAALYRQQSEHPLIRRVDKVGGSLGQDGAENAFAIYAPFGDKGPFFHVHVDGRQAAQQPAQQNLEQAEHTRQHQLQQGQHEQAQQHNQQQAQSGHGRSL